MTTSRILRCRHVFRIYLHESQTTLHQPPLHHYPLHDVCDVNSTSYIISSFLIIPLHPLFHLSILNNAPRNHFSQDNQPKGKEH
jgi:hypothetical protein